MKFDHETYVVGADSMVCTAEPAEWLPLGQAYFFY